MNTEKKKPEVYVNPPPFFKGMTPKEIAAARKHYVDAKMRGKRVLEEGIANPS